MRRHIDRSLVVRSRAKRRQASKLAEIRQALVAAGFDTVRRQATALGVKRPTAWALLNRDKRTGPSAKIIKRILSSPNLPTAVRRRVEEYIEQKIEGVYGHNEARRRWFRDQFHGRTRTKTRPGLKRRKAENKTDSAHGEANESVLGMPALRCRYRGPVLASNTNLIALWSMELAMNDTKMLLS